MSTYAFITLFHRSVTLLLFDPLYSVIHLLRHICHFSSSSPTVPSTLHLWFHPSLHKEEGHRILVFSQWTRLLDLLEVLLYDIDLHFLRLDGSTPVKVTI